MNSATSARIRGAVGGSVFLTFFGCAWIVIALENWSGHPDWSVPFAVVATLALLAGCAVRLRGAGRGSSVRNAARAEAARRTNTAFGVIFAVEGVSIGVCCAVLSAFALSDWIPIAIAAIVGIHFLPLARVFKVPFYNVTGAFCVASMVACAAIRNVDMRLLSAGLAMGGILWASVVTILVTTRHGE